MCIRCSDFAQVFRLWEKLTARIGREISIGDPISADLQNHPDAAYLVTLQQAAEIGSTPTHTHTHIRHECDTRTCHYTHTRASHKHTYI